MASMVSWVGRSNRSKQRYRVTPESKSWREEEGQ